MSAFNGSGTFVVSGTGLPYVTGTTISSTVANQLNTDLATGLSTVICKDGQTTPTANLPMGGFKHTTVADATARNQYASMGQVQDRIGAYAAAGGTVDVITATFSPAYTALTDGMQITVKAAGANTTTTPTLAINGLTATTITKLGGKALQAGDIYGAGHELLLVYSSTGTRWELANPSVSPFINRATLTLTTRSGITSAAGVMLGYGATLALTPTLSGRVRMSIASFATSAASQVNSYYVYFGTGAAPANGAALTGTNPSGGNIDIAHSPTIVQVNTSLVWEFSGLTVGTAYWFDIGVQAGSSGSTNYSARLIVVQEIP